MINEKELIEFIKEKIALDKNMLSSKIKRLSKHLKIFDKLTGKVEAYEKVLDFIKGEIKK